MKPMSASLVDAIADGRHRDGSHGPLPEEQLRLYREAKNAGFVVFRSVRHWHQLLYRRWCAAVGIAYIEVRIRRGLATIRLDATRDDGGAVATLDRDGWRAVWETAVRLGGRRNMQMAGGDTGLVITYIPADSAAEVARALRAALKVRHAPAVHRRRVS